MTVEQVDTSSETRPTQRAKMYTKNNDVYCGTFELASITHGTFIVVGDGRTW